MGTRYPSQAGSFIITFAAAKIVSRSRAFTYDGPSVQDFGHVCVGGKVGSTDCIEEKYNPMMLTGNLYSRTSDALEASRLMFFSGKDLAVADVSPRARVEGSGCERTLWSSSSWVVCKYAVGLGTSKSVTAVSVQYSQYLGTITTALSFDKPSASGVKGRKYSHSLCCTDVFEMLTFHFLYI